MWLNRNRHSSITKPNRMYIEHTAMQHNYIIKESNGIDVLESNERFLLLLFRLYVVKCVHSNTAFSAYVLGLSEFMCGPPKV